MMVHCVKMNLPPLAASMMLPAKRYLKIRTKVCWCKNLHIKQNCSVCRILDTTFSPAKIPFFYLQSKSRWCNYFSGHFTVFSEKKSFRLSRKIFSVFKIGETRDIFASQQSNNHNSLTCNHFELERHFPNN